MNWNQSVFNLERKGLEENVAYLINRVYSTIYIPCNARYYFRYLFISFYFPESSFCQHLWSLGQQHTITCFWLLTQNLHLMLYLRDIFSIKCKILEQSQIIFDIGLTRSLWTFPNNYLIRHRPNTMDQFGLDRTESTDWSERFF